MTDLTPNEKTFSKPFFEIPITLPNQSIETIKTNWNLLDKASDSYAKLLQEYDISELLKTILTDLGKDKQVHVFPKPGNLDLKDKEVGFHEFIVLLEHMKKNKRLFKKPEAIERLKKVAQPIVQYILSGKHSKSDFKFSGWKSSIRSKKPLYTGILSIDLPQYKDIDQYVCGGTQHYIAFGFNVQSNTLYIFDSASKDSIKENTEVYYLLRFIFEELLKKPITVQSVTFSSILQPGAGDKSEEDEFSYNNQNVFCHTWSLWFLTMFGCFYDLNHPTESMDFIMSLSHRDALLNLGMIKNYALWILPYIQEEPKDVSKQFPIRAYERAKEKNDSKRLHEILEHYLLLQEPLKGLDYIYSYKNKHYISLEDLKKKRKLKMNIFLVSNLETITIENYKLALHSPKKKKYNP